MQERPVAVHVGARTKLTPGAGFATVNGLRVYYEVHGNHAGSVPLFLLHGGVGAGEMFEPLLPAIAEGRQAVAVHLQGHGHTADRDRPLRFEEMADDLAGLLTQLGIESADLMGYSLGGAVSVQTAIRHPESVRRLVIVSTVIKRQGFYPEVLADMAQMGPERARFMEQSPLSKLYPGKDWPGLFAKLPELLQREYDWSKEFASLKLPVMAIYADADAIKPSHIVETWDALGGGHRDAGLDGSDRPKSRLAILPGKTHYDSLTYPGLAAMVASFLDAPLSD